MRVENLHPLRVSFPQGNRTRLQRVRPESHDKKEREIRQHSDGAPFDTRCAADESTGDGQ